MPNPQIRYKGSDRPYVQYERPELEGIWEDACLENNFKKVEEILYELSHRHTKKSKKLKSRIEEKIANPKYFK